MSRPRPMVKGQVVLVTRRTVERRFMTRPESWLEAAFWFLLGVYSARTGVRVVAGVLMSNHYHLLVWDREGRLPEFVESVDMALARVVNEARGHRGSVWDGREPHYEVLLDPAVSLSAAAYVLANPVAAGLVEHGRDWPGARSRPDWVGTARNFRRPRGFKTILVDGGRYPDSVDLEFVAPPGWEVSGPGRFARELSARVAEREAAARAAVRAEGRRFAGVRRVLSTAWRAEPDTEEKEERVRPCVAASDERVKRAWLEWREAFWKLYARALARFVSGDWGVVFPKPTWRMQRIFHVPVG